MRFYSAPVQDAEPLYQRKPKAQPSLLTVQGLAALHERLEQIRQQIGRDALSVVLNHQPPESVVAADPLGYGKSNIAFWNALRNSGIAPRRARAPQFCPTVVRTSPARLEPRLSLRSRRRRA